jgi:hypothetical protein
MTSYYELFRIPIRVSRPAMAGKALSFSPPLKACHQCRRCSTHVRRCKTRCRLHEEASRREDNGYAGRECRCFYRGLVQLREPWGTCTVCKLKRSTQDCPNQDASCSCAVSCSRSRMRTRKRLRTSRYCAFCFLAKLLEDIAALQFCGTVFHLIQSI